VGQPLLVFVHSPLVGPLTWRAVADRLAAQGYPVAVPDVRAALSGGPPYHDAVARAVAAALAGHGGHRPTVLFGHSGAGPLLPRIARELAAPPAAVVYVDALLPHPGRSWFDSAPPELGARLRALAGGGTTLPPWHEWFPADVVAALLPDERMRAAFTAEVPRLPLAYLAEPASADDWSGPAGYVLLSEAYRDAADAARAAGMPVVERLGHHLAPVSDPDGVADAARRVLVDLTLA
jgi:hypothetical protein